MVTVTTYWMNNTWCVVILTMQSYLLYVHVAQFLYIFPSQPIIFLLNCRRSEGKSISGLESLLNSRSLCKHVLVCYIYYSCAILSGVSSNLCVKYACRGYKNFAFSTCTPTELKILFTGNNTLKQCRSNHRQFCVHGTHYGLTVHE